MKIPLPAKIVILLLTALVAWNYWLPAAEDMFNHVSQPGDGNNPDLINVDFNAYYTAGNRFSQGDNPYYWGRDKQGNRAFSDYLYPPVMLPIFSLVAHLDYDPARVLWLALYALSFLAILGIMARSMPAGWAFPFLAAGTLLTLLSFPLLDHILTGQADIFVIALILGSYLAHAANKRGLSAVLLAVGTLLKVSPLFLLAYFVLFLRDFRYLLVYLATIVVASGISLIFVPPGYYSDYFFSVLPEVGRGTGEYLNQSIVSYVSFSPLLARLISLSGLGALAILAWFMGASFTPAERMPVIPLASDHFRSEVVFILCISWVLIFLGKAWPATYVWLILPSVWLLVGLIRLRVKPAFLAVVILGILLVMAKSYGIPGLTTLNLWGNILLTTTLIIAVLGKGFFSQTPDTSSKP